MNLQVKAMHFVINYLVVRLIHFVHHYHYVQLIFLVILIFMLINYDNLQLLLILKHHVILLIIYRPKNDKLNFTTKLYMLKVYHLVILTFSGLCISMSLIWNGVIYVLWNLLALLALSQNEKVDHDGVLFLKVALVKLMSLLLDVLLSDIKQLQKLNLLIEKFLILLILMPLLDSFLVDTTVLLLWRIKLLLLLVSLNSIQLHNNVPFLFPPLPLRSQYTSILHLFFLPISSLLIFVITWLLRVPILVHSFSPMYTIICFSRINLFSQYKIYL
mmetsp:Transcript_23353/g.30297  ORF Transcript_23353/g.30297 Transcript_23353/m.30297 type:complete len:273 (+) Transcript_23353:2854-3672(+)